MKADDKMRFINTHPLNFETGFCISRFASVHLPSGWWIVELTSTNKEISVPVNYFLWEALETPGISDPIEVLEFLEHWGKPFEPAAADLSIEESTIAFSEAIKGHYISPSGDNFTSARLQAAEELFASPELLERNDLTELDVQQLNARLFCHTEVIARLQTMYKLSKTIIDFMRSPNEHTDTGQFQTLNNALKVYAPQIVIEESFQRTNHNVFSEAALQMFIALSNDLKLKHCGNEACYRIFVFQRGRSSSAIHRSTDATKYCSHKCAKSQTQRVRRQQRSEVPDYD